MADTFNDDPLQKWLESSKVGHLYKACKEEGYDDLLSSLRSCIVPLLYHHKTNQSCELYDCFNN